MKPLEILSALPQGARARPDAIVDSPAFAMPCRLGEESVVVRRASVEPAMSEMLALAVTFGDEPHELCLARSPRFPDLDRLWDRRGEVPQAVLLALVEKECGPLFQALENAVNNGMTEPEIVNITGLDALTYGNESINAGSIVLVDTNCNMIIFSFTPIDNDVAKIAYGIISSSLMPAA